MCIPGFNLLLRDAVVHLPHTSGPADFASTVAFDFRTASDARVVADTVAADARAVAAARADTAVARAFAPDGGTSGPSTLYGRAVVACSNAAAYMRVAAHAAGYAAYAYASGYADAYNCTSVSAVTAAASFAAAVAYAGAYAAFFATAATYATSAARSAAESAAVGCICRVSAHAASIFRSADRAAAYLYTARAAYAYAAADAAKTVADSSFCFCSSSC